MTDRMDSQKYIKGKGIIIYHHSSKWRARKSISKPVNYCILGSFSINKTANKDKNAHCTFKYKLKQNYMVIRRAIKTEI